MLDVVATNYKEYEMKRLMIALVAAFAVVSCGGEKRSEEPNKERAIVGADRLLADQFDLVKGKRVALVVNHTARIADGTHLIDALVAAEDVEVVALFGPEHGIRGDAAAGEDIVSGKDEKTGLPIYSLYGESNKPTAEQLDGADAIVFDIQDVGARFYTYISTLYYVLQSAAENDVAVIVPDRPNPIGGKAEGPIRQEGFSSFVGIAPIPVRHGMTVGELAKFFVGEGLLKTETDPKLEVVPVLNWKRDEYYDETGLEWIAPSPNMPNLETAIVYPGVCFFEGTNLSEGRGTNEPFLQFGAPFAESVELINKIGSYGVEGVAMEATSYTPKSLPDMSPNPKFKGETVNGVKIKVVDREKFDPVFFGVAATSAFRELYPEDFEFKERWFDLLTGSSQTREMIEAGKTPREIADAWSAELTAFEKTREKYLLYQ
jgi:beta-N-acetylhexosaminidase